MFSPFVMSYNMVLTFESVDELDQLKATELVLCSVLCCLLCCTR